MIGADGSYESGHQDTIEQQQEWSMRVFVVCSHVES